MISPELLALLRCPETQQTLQLAAPEVLQRIRQEGLPTASGAPLSAECEGGLLRADGRRFFPICGGLPNLLLQDSVPL